MTNLNLWTVIYYNYYGHFGNHSACILQKCFWFVICTIFFYAYAISINTVLSPNYFFQQARKVKLYLFICFLKTPKQFFQESSMLEATEVVPQHSNLQWSSRQWPSLLFCVFCWLAVAFSFLRHCLGRSVPDWRSFSEKFPDCSFFYLACFIYIYNHAACR